MIVAGIGAAPNPDAQRRVTRPNGGAFSWTELPEAGRSGPAPALPRPPLWLEEGGGWPVATRTAWKAVWESPQATAWDQSGRSLHGWAQLHAVTELHGPQSSKMSEMRQIEDRHGLNPAALLKLRWRIVPTVAEEIAAPKRATKPKDRRARVLKLVADGEATRR